MATPIDDGRDDVIAASPRPRIAVHGGGTFPVRRIYCVGRNFADHAREMGAAVAATPAERGDPVLFLKPGDAIVTDGQVTYPPGTHALHHEVELVVAIGRDAAPGSLAAADAQALVFGYAVGLDLTRRDLQGAAKAAGLPWDTGKSFDDCAPIGQIRRAADVGALEHRVLSLHVNGELRQSAPLSDWIWNIADILQALSGLYALRAGDLVFMGTPAGVAALQSGDACVARLDDVLSLDCSILPPIAAS